MEIVSGNGPYITKMIPTSRGGGAFQRRTGSRGAFFEAFFESQEFSCPAPGVEFYTTTNTTFKQFKKGPKRSNKKKAGGGGLAPPAAEKKGGRFQQDRINQFLSKIGRTRN